jgi:hypothetical protein
MMRDPNTASIGAVTALIFLLMISACSGGTSGGSEAKIYSSQEHLEWDPPATRADGSPLSPADIQGYKVYYGTSSRSYSHGLPVGNVTSIMISDLNFPAGGTYYVAVTDYDANGSESDYSDELVFRVQ